MCDLYEKGIFGKQKEPCAQYPPIALQLFILLTNQNPPTSFTSKRVNYIINSFLTPHFMQLQTTTTIMCGNKVQVSKHINQLSIQHN